MKLFQIENNCNYTAKCTLCPSLLKFNIDINNLLINGECKNGHIFENIKPDQMIDFIKNTYYSKNFCYKCQAKLNEDLKNQICLDCNKLFCHNCIKNHIKEKSHKTNLFNINNRFCNIHKVKITLFCEECKANICTECKSLHKDHIIKPFFEIIPNNIKKKTINMKIEEYKKKIDDLLCYITQKKNEIDTRFIYLNNFFNSLLYINEKLIKKFNNSIFDYYNYQNFQNFVNYQYDETCFDKSKNLNYLLYGENSKETLKKESSIQGVKIENKYENQYIGNFNCCNYNNLKYLESNKFFLCEQKDGKTLINFYEYKDFTFKLYFSKKLGNCNIINNIKKGNYNNIFITTRENRIFLVKFDLKDKTAFMSKLYDPHHKRNFHDVIDIGNDIYVISYPKGLKIFKDFYTSENVIKSIGGYYTLLNGINESIFIAEEKNSEYHFYDSEKHNKIKSINFPLGFKYEGIVKNDLVVFTHKFACFYFVDIKNLEIVQILDYLKGDKFISINNNYMFECLYEKGIMKINKYNNEEGCFEYLISLSIGTDNISIKNIKLIDKNFTLLSFEEELEIFNY